MNTVPEKETIMGVGDFTRRLKVMLERNVPACWVRGEVSNLRRQHSGHVYFTLKDKDSQLPCVLFRGDALRQTVEPEDGRQVVVFGNLSLYEPRGAYQLICREVVEDGVGRLQREFERLKKKLADEGLFDADRKVPLPTLPRRVAIVTSPSGAALRDFLSILERRRWRGRVIIIPAKVQGVGASEEIAAGIEAASALGVAELLVVARGGGSIEDLWCFNEERVVRALAACPLPTLSAVGHEIDFTLADFAADKRAETPSAAAELITSAWVRCMERLRAAEKALLDAPEWVLERLGSQLKLLAGRMEHASPQRRVEKGMLQLDDLSTRLVLSLREILYLRRSMLAECARRLQGVSPERRVEVLGLRLRGVDQRFRRLQEQGLRAQAERLERVASRLESSSLPRILARGFAVVRDVNGDLVTRCQGLEPGDALAVDFADGEVHVEVRRSG